MVDGGGLENRCTRKGTGGSNPSPSETSADPEPREPLEPLEPPEPYAVAISLTGTSSTSPDTGAGAARKRPIAQPTKDSSATSRAIVK